MAKNNNLQDYLQDLYEGIKIKKPNASKNPQNFRSEIESITTSSSADADAVAADIRLNKTAYVNDVKISGTIEDYDGSILVNGAPYIVGNTPFCTGVDIIRNDNNTDELKTTITPARGYVSYGSEGEYKDYYYHSRFYFTVPEEAADSLCRVVVVYASDEGGGTCFAAIGKLNTETETGSKTDENFIKTKEQSVGDGSSAHLSNVFDKVQPGSYFVDTQAQTSISGYFTVTASVTFE